MSILVIGSIALDTIETPYGKAEEILGGSATYISTCISYFVKPVRIVGVVGDDFPQKYLEYLKEKDIDLAGLQVHANQKTFRWGGKYDKDLSDRETLFTELNVFETFNPVIPEEYRSSKYICLGNIDPKLQLKVLEQMESPQMVFGDTMNFWIKGKNSELRETLKKLSVIFISDSEARQLSGKNNLVSAGKEILAMGPDNVVIKKGEHGAMLITQDFFFTVPAFPIENVYDPTGAGDAFAGGFIGWLASTGDHSRENIKRALIYGNVMASFCIEKFSLERLTNLNEEEIQKRVRVIQEISQLKGD